MLIYLADKTQRLLAPSGPDRYEALQWSMFQIASVGPMMGQLGHFKGLAEPIDYATQRFESEVRRILNVLEKHLTGRHHLAGEFSIADILNFAWVKNLGRFGFQRDTLPAVSAWLDRIAARPAVARALALQP